MNKKDFLRRVRRKNRARYAVAVARKASAEKRLRLSIFRSSQHIYAQVIDDEARTTCVSASSLEKEFKGVKGEPKEIAAKVGKLLGERAVAGGHKFMIADKGPYRYHGRVAALVDAVREAGINV